MSSVYTVFSSRIELLVLSSQSSQSRGVESQLELIYFAK